MHSQDTKFLIGHRRMWWEVSPNPFPPTTQLLSLEATSVNNFLYPFLQIFYMHIFIFLIYCLTQMATTLHTRCFPVYLLFKKLVRYYTVLYTRLLGINYHFSYVRLCQQDKNPKSGLVGSKDMGVLILRDIAQGKWLLPLNFYLYN